MEGDIPVKERREIIYQIKTINNYLSRNASPGMTYFSEITSNIYICGYELSIDLELLKNYKIQNIINLSGVKKPENVKRGYAKMKINEWTLEVGDSPEDDIAEYFDKTYDIIHESVRQKHHILVHSQNSISRSVAIVANYLLRRFYTINYTSMEDLVDGDYFLLQILKFIKQSRTCAHPNAGFIKQLILEEYRLKQMFKPHVLHHLAEKERLKKHAEQKDDDPVIESHSESEDLGFSNKEEESSVDLYDDL